jgi:hypothetical protein
MMTLLIQPKDSILLEEFAKVISKNQSSWYDNPWYFWVVTSVAGLFLAILSYYIKKSSDNTSNTIDKVERAIGNIGSSLEKHVERLTGALVEQGEHRVSISTMKDNQIRILQDIQMLERAKTELEKEQIKIANTVNSINHITLVNGEDIAKIESKITNLKDEFSKEVRRHDRCQAYNPLKD